MVSRLNVSDIIVELVNKLFEHECRRLNKISDTIVQKNREISDDHPDAFYYGGIYFSDHYTTIRRGVAIGKLDPSLIPEVTEYLEEEKRIRFDQQMVRQALALTLTGIETIQDLRDALPNQLAEMLEATKHLNRTRPEAFMIQDDPRKMKQYQKLREKVEYYSATRLIY